MQLWWDIFPSLFEMVLKDAILVTGEGRGEGEVGTEKG